MSSAFANNTAHLYSSDHTKNNNSKTIYNHLRKLSSHNSKCSQNNHFSNYSGSITLKRPTIPATTPVTTPQLNATLTNVRSYDLLHLINQYNLLQINQLI